MLFRSDTTAYIALHDADASTVVREALLLDICEALENAGIKLAFPSPPVVLNEPG